jgi:hypothetical protein
MQLAGVGQIQHSCRGEMPVEPCLFMAHVSICLSQSPYPVPAFPVLIVFSIRLD